jgi:hypothetical protein
MEKGNGVEELVKSVMIVSHPGGGGVLFNRQNVIYEGIGGLKEVLEAERIKEYTKVCVE